MNGLIIHYEEYETQLNMLDTNQKGILLESLISVAKGEATSSEMDPLTKMCFAFMRDRVIRDQEISEKRAKARKKDEPETSTEQNETKNNKPEQKKTKVNSNTNTDSNTDTDERDICASDSTEDDAEKLFIKVWEMYPCKKGLGTISTAQKVKLFKEVGEEQLIRALQRYKDEHKQKEVRGDFTPPWKNGSTWFNSGYVDYLDSNYQPAPPDPPKRSGTGSGLLNYEQSGTDYDAVADQIWMEELEGSGAE